MFAVLLLTFGWKITLGLYYRTVKGKEPVVAVGSKAVTDDALNFLEAFFLFHEKNILIRHR